MPLTNTFKSDPILNGPFHIFQAIIKYLLTYYRKNIKVDYFQMVQNNLECHNRHCIY